MRKKILLLLSIACVTHGASALPSSHYSVRTLFESVDVISSFNDATKIGIAANQCMYPNPASNFVVLEVDLGAEPKGAAILVQDIAGRVLVQLVVSSKELQLVLDSRTLAPGTYSVLLQNHGATLETKKLIIRQ